MATAVYVSSIDAAGTSQTVGSFLFMDDGTNEVKQLPPLPTLVRLKIVIDEAIAEGQASMATLEAALKEAKK